MDMVGWYVALTVVALGIAVGVRQIVYTMLVKQSRWLPEKATKMANIGAGVTIGVAVLALIGKALITH